ncbi:Gigaxonin [Chelonia mydas]|uniref:Gigaxonin n=1 Tax=Chelonia mydas TaxID=8469 RepID=M7BE45_CHEMY|nr:Gigaxonin [Chelonia mydas]
MPPKSGNAKKRCHRNAAEKRQHFSAAAFRRTKLNYNPPKDDGSTYKIELEGISVEIMREILDYIFSGQVHLKDVMSAVWVSGLDSTYLREQMMSEPLVREIVKECNNIPLTPPQQGEAMSRKPTAVMRCMCPLYDPNRQLWIELAPMSIPRINHGVLSAEGFLFVLGGQDENKETLSSGEKYDPDSNSWSSLPAMNEARSLPNCMGARHNFGLVEIDGILYILGGEDGERELCSMECYDIYNKTWTKQPDLTMVRKIGCYAAMKKKIYAMGGGSYGKLFESVECYDPRIQQWTAICPLKERRFGAVACGVASELYVFGGVRSRDDNQASEMVTCKSEFYHDEFKRWIYLNDQNLCIPASSSFVYGAVPIGASIYVIGDLDTGTNYDYVREFKRSTGTWHHTKPLFPSDLRRTGCAALRIANCKLFRLQLQQGLFRIRVPSS